MYVPLVILYAVVPTRFCGGFAPAVKLTVVAKVALVINPPNVTTVPLGTAAVIVLVDRVTELAATAVIVVPAAILSPETLIPIANEDVSGKLSSVVFLAV